MYVRMRRLCYCWFNHEARNSIHEVTERILREWAANAVHWCLSQGNFRQDCVLKVTFLTVTWYFGTFGTGPRLEF